MINIEAASIDEAYSELLSRFAEPGLGRTASRLGETIDLGPVAIDLAPGRLKLLTLPSRALNPYLAIVEACWALAGRNDVETLSFVARIFRSFSDDGATLYGAYGYRLRRMFSFDQIENMIEQLSADQFSRRVFSVISHADDARSSSLDVPCNVMIMMRIRDKRLDISVINRSNDVIFGLPYDVFLFSLLHSFVASRLRIPIGRHIHFSNAMHLYVSNFDIAKRTVEQPLSPYSRDATETDVASFMQELIDDHEKISCLNFDEMKGDRLRKFLRGFLSYRANDLRGFDESLTEDWLGRSARAWAERPLSSSVSANRAGI